MQNIKIYYIFKTCEEILTVGETEIENDQFYRYERPIWLEDFDKILVSNKISSVEKSINTLLIMCMMIIKLTYYI